MAECFATLTTLIPLGVAQTVPTAVYTCLFLVSGITIMDTSSKIFKNERFTFKCHSNHLLQQECLDQYNRGPNQLQANALLPAVHFILAFLILAVSIIVLNVVAKKHLKRRRTGAVHLYTVHFIFLAIRFLFYLGMIVTFGVLHKKVNLASSFSCKLLNSTKSFDCTDSKASAKAALNIGQLVVDSVCLVLTIAEFIWLCFKWKKLTSEARVNEICPKCKEFAKFFIFSIGLKEEDGDEEQPLGKIVIETLKLP